MRAQKIADEAKPVALLRHRPGRQSRMHDLAAYLDADSGADPLAGNYVILQQQDIILNFQGLSEALSLKAFTGNPGPSAALVETGSLLAGPSGAGKQIAVTTGDFNNDTLDEIACVYNDAGNLTLVTAFNQDPAQSDDSLAIAGTTTLGQCGSGNARIAAGNLTVQPAATLAIAWPDTNGCLALQVWETDAGLKPSSVAAATGPGLTVLKNGTFDLAVGDCNGDGVDEIIVALQGAADASGNTLFLQLWSITPASTLQLVASVGVAATTGSFSVTTGSFLAGSTAIQVALAWADETGHACVRLFELHDSALTPCSAAYQNITYLLANPSTVRIASGDLDLDGVDELVLANVCNRLGYQAALALTVFKPDNNLNLLVTSQGTCGVANQAFASIDTSIAIGAIGAGAFYGIVVSTLGTAGVLNPLEGIARVYVGVVEVNPSLQLPSTMVNGVAPPVSLLDYDAAQDPALNLALSMSLGDFSGKSLRVGPPTPYTFDVVNQVLAIVNAPPLQTNVNFDGASMLTFNNSKMQSTSVGVTVTKDWTTSDTLGVNLDLPVIGQLNASLTRTYGQGFSKTADSMSMSTQTISINLWKDDLIVVSATSYNAWEYPVYDDATGTPKGHLLIAFPDLDGLQTQYLDGTSQYLCYAPDHLPGSLLSYSTQAPLDYAAGTSINKPLLLDVGTLQETVTVDWSDSNTQSQQTTNQISTSINAGGNTTINFLDPVNIGIQAHFSDTYTKQQMSNYSVTFTETTSVTISFANVLDQSEEYAVSPYIYFSTQGGFLVVDYAVSISDSANTYWGQNFSKPNAALNLPWASSTNPSLKAMTRSIKFVANADGTVTVSARIGNYSLVPTTGIVVQFSLGGAPNQNIGGPVTIPQLQPMERQNVSVTWTPPTTPGTYQVWATVSPANTNGPNAFAQTKGFASWTVGT